MMALLSNKYFSIILLGYCAALINRMIKGQHVEVAPGVGSYKIAFNEQCELPDSLVSEIQSQASVVKTIVEHVMTNDTHKTYDTLAYFVDTFGARPTGSQALEDSLDYLIEEMTKAGLENVHTEPVDIENHRWKRGEETLVMVEPREQPMKILGLGGTISTPPEGIRAQALVVNNFTDLEEKRDFVSGKIVVFNYEYNGYSSAYVYRQKGAQVAGAYGAVATLIRSPTDYSLYTPHTGVQNYDPEVAPIPTACITVEDVELIKRITDRGQNVVLHLKINASQYTLRFSRNVIGEIRGYLYPEQTVIFGGHTDSWDIGQGAMDDGGGVFISWRSLALLKQLGLRPKRTLRVVLWTAEEVGLVGAKAYYNAHKFEQHNISLAMESDYGTFEPLGLALHSTKNKTQCVVREVLKLFEFHNTTSLILKDDGPDLMYWRNDGIPTASLYNANDRYFHYHHTEADTMTVLDPDVLDRCTAFWAAVTYVFANLDDMMDK